MDFELSDDQRALAGAARDLLAKRSAPERVRAVVDGGGWDRDLWQAMVDQGWTGITVPGPLGGVGLGWVEVAVLLEQVGAHLAPAPILQHLVALDAVVAALGDGVTGAEAWVEPLVSGTAVAAAVSTPVAVAGDDASGWRLSGTPEPVVFGPSADVLVVPAVGSEGEEGLFLVERAGDARPSPEPAMDRTRELAWLHFDATPAVRLGPAEAAARHLDRGATAYAAELLGVCSRAMDMAVAYAKERVQFGRPIGSFQAVKHRCADMLVDVEGMRSTALYAAWAIGAGDPDAAVAASTAKTWCSDASKRVLASTLQVHGGVGFTWESDVHLYLKRGQLDQVSFGDATFHRTRLARFLKAKVEAGDSVI